ncbi:MAG: hypothetical protein LBU80_07195 [Rikenellaceae bacterium]|jgi:hypothetical protein|nr:hypothetical protein [Rikenellaceae bacterium]
MTGDEFQKELETRLEPGVKVYWTRLILDHNLWIEAMDLALGKRPPVPFRASYALEGAFFEKPDDFVPYHQRFVRDFCTATDESVFRHYGKMMAHLLKRQWLTLSDDEATAVAEEACVRLIDSRLRVAVRAWSLEVLLLLRGRVGWIDEEWAGIIEQLRIDPSPGIQSCLRRLKTAKTVSPSVTGVGVA